MSNEGGELIPSVIVPAEQAADKAETLQHLESKNPPEIQEIIEKVRQGDVDAQVAMDQLLRNRVFGYFRRQGGELANRAEDLTQEVLLRIFIRIFQYNESKGLFTSWVLGVAHNMGIDEGRRIASRAVANGPDIRDPEFSWIPSDADVEDEVLTHANQEEIANALASLPVEQALVVKLAYHGDLTESEIAKKLGIALGTVKTRKRLGMKKLHDLLMKVAT